MSENITRENQVILFKAVGLRVKRDRMVPDVTVFRIGERNGVTYGTCKVDGIACAVTLKTGHYWNGN